MKKILIHMSSLLYLLLSANCFACSIANTTKIPLDTDGIEDWYGIYDITIKNNNIYKIYYSFYLNASNWNIGVNSEQMTHLHVKEYYQGEYILNPGESVTINDAVLASDWNYVPFISDDGEITYILTPAKIGDSVNICNTESGPGGDAIFVYTERWERLDGTSWEYTDWIAFNASAIIINSNWAAPEPTTMILFGTGIAGLAALGRKKRA